MKQSKLSADPTALILGIVALVIGFAGCCCYGLFAIIPLALSIVGFVMANKSLKNLIKILMYFLCKAETM